LIECLDVIEFGEDRKLRVVVEIFDAFCIVYIGRFDCCLVLHINILGSLFFRLCFFGPDREEGVAVGAAVVLVGRFFAFDEEFRVKLIQITLLFIILNNSVQITLQPEQLES
jgi:hypothetical protein